jgi:hypothetical protein
MSILVTLVFLTLFLLFAFVINIGVLISEKINLQNAADLAAYAGASVQARLLNGIGYMNFRIRQEWKEFAFNQWVTFQRSDMKHPAHYAKQPAGRNLGSMTDAYATFACMCLTGLNYEGLQSNYCRAGCSISLPGVPKADPLFRTPLTQAVAEAYTQVRDQYYADWEKWKKDSEQVANQVMDEFEGRMVRLNAIQQAYVDYLNELGQIRDPLKGNDVLSEIVKTTLLKNLSIGNAQTLTALNLIPKNPDNPWFKTIPLRTVAMVPYAMMHVAPDGLGIFITPSAPPYGEPLTRDVQLGVAKDISTFTYYALRLISKPNLIYLPEHWEPVLVSYASAKPFGSRVGPQVIGNKTSDATLLLKQQAGQFTSPNFAFYQGDMTGIKSVGQMDILSNMIVGKAEKSAWPKANNDNWQAVLSVRAPNHYDATRFPVFVDPTKIPDPPSNAFMAEHYPDGLDFLGSTPLFPPDLNAHRRALFGAQDGPGYDMAYDYLTLAYHNDENGSKTARATLIQTQSSYATPYELEQGIGRTGYSVKLVNMNQIMRLYYETAQGERQYIRNLPTGDSNVENTQTYPAGQWIWY